MGRIVGFGAERIELPVTASYAEVIERRMVMLARCLNMKTTVAFIGAGCSIPLGYPDWGGLTRGAAAAVQAALAARNETRYAGAIARCAHAARRPTLAADEFLAILGFCQKVSESLSSEGLGDPFRDFLDKTFSAQRSSPGTLGVDVNPYEALLQFPIYRFITTNYDLELEHAIARNSPEELVRMGFAQGVAKESRLSFTQTDDYVLQLSSFPLGLRDRIPTVFHCHGRYDEPDSMIITERDYQKWYLRDTPPGRAFRQNMELLFGSNPILFVGFSMSDNDLLHALRLLSAAEPSRERPRTRSLFALLPNSGDDLADRDRDDLLLERYRVHVIPYAPSEGRKREPVTSREWGIALCGALTDLRKSSINIREEFINKPAIRKVSVPVRPPKPYLHYAVARDNADDLAPDRTQSDLDYLTSLIGKKPVIVIHGYGGIGKSWRVLDLIEQVRANRRGVGSDGIFFWSSYYADDWLTGLERLLVYFGSEPTPRKNRIERFSDCLTERRLIVFDGFERLLRSHGSRDEWTAANRSVEQLLEAARGGNATVILTTRLMPKDLRNDQRVGEFSMRRITTEELANGAVFRSMTRSGLLNDDDLAAVCSLCDGHSYALALAAAFLRGEGDQNIHERLKELRRKLSDASPARRLSRMIRMSVEDVEHRTSSRASELLERIAIFMSPVTEAMMDVCADGKPSDIDLQALLGARLLFRVHADPYSSDSPSGYTVHPMVRNYMFHHSQGDRLDSVPNFSLSGFTAGATPVDPGLPKSVEKIRKMFTLMHDGALKALEAADSDRARQLCRGAFGVVRSRMEANSVARWTTYDDYVDAFEIPLMNLVKLVSPSMWDYMDRSHAASKEHGDGPLYADELAWLWNDLGLAFYAQGSMVDAHAVWEVSYEIDHVTDSYEDGGQYLLQSRLDMAAAYLEMGNLDSAREYLADTEDSNLSYGDNEYAGRITGYKALLTHLRGNTDEADRLYEKAEVQLREVGRNLRGRSIFAHHHANLKMLIGDPKGAETLSGMSTAFAYEGKHFDLITYARIVKGNLLRAANHFREAQLEYDTALLEAKRIGIRRLEADLLCELARLALDVGDWETARQRAVASLMIANELWLGLRRSTGLVVLGKAMVEAHNVKLGTAYLHHAYTLAKKQGYLLRANEAEKELHDLGEPHPEM
jgi:tetratricopeptide (TPR) repeat protein